MNSNYIVLNRGVTWYDTFWWALNLLYWLEMEVREEWKQRNHYKTKVRVENVLYQDGSIGGGKWSKSGYVLDQSCVCRCEWMWENKEVNIKSWFLDWNSWIIIEKIVDRKNIEVTQLSIYLSLTYPLTIRIISASFRAR